MPMKNPLHPGHLIKTGLLRMQLAYDVAQTRRQHSRAIVIKRYVPA